MVAVVVVDLMLTGEDRSSMVDSDSLLNFPGNDIGKCRYASQNLGKVRCDREAHARIAVQGCASMPLPTLSDGVVIQMGRQRMTRKRRGRDPRVETTAGCSSPRHC